MCPTPKLEGQVSPVLPPWWEGSPGIGFDFYRRLRLEKPRGGNLTYLYVGIKQVKEKLAEPVINLQLETSEVNEFYK